MDPKIRLAMNYLGWLMLIVGGAGTVAGIMQGVFDLAWQIEFLPLSAFLAAPGVFLVLITRVPRSQNGGESSSA
jgi:hypothetical protein